MEIPDKSERLIRHFVNEDSVLRGYVYAATRNHQDTADILQEIWRVLTEKLDQFDESRSFRAWALGVARLQVLKWRQSLGRSKETPSDTVIELLADTAVQHADELDVRISYLEKCLRRLNLRVRKIMDLKYLSDLRSREISARLGCSVAVVDMTISRARHFLRECIEEQARVELTNIREAKRP